MLNMGTDYEIININSGDLKVRIEDQYTSMAGKLNLKPIYFFQESLEIDNSRLFFVMYGSSSFIVKSDMKDDNILESCMIQDLKKALLGNDWVYLEDRNFHEIKLFPVNCNNDFVFVAKSRGSGGDYPSKTGSMSSDAVINIVNGRIDTSKINLVSRYGNVCDYIIEMDSFNEDVFLESTLLNKNDVSLQEKGLKEEYILSM